MGTEVLKGEVESIRHRNEDTGFAIFAIKTIQEETVVCLGTVPAVSKGVTLQLEGDWVMHNVYGKQFKISSYEEVVPTTQDGMIKYLSSGVVRGVGKRIAQKIVEKFGDNAFDIIQKQPEELTKIRGITIDRAKKMHESFCQHDVLRAVMIRLQEFDISPAYAVIIYELYKDNAIKVVEKYPYRLCDDVKGIGFKKADKIAVKGGISIDSNERIKSGIKYVLKEAITNGGHCYLPVAELYEKTRELLELQELQMPKMVELLVELQVVDKAIMQETSGDDTFVYNRHYYNAENIVADKLLEFSLYKTEGNMEQLEKDIEATIELLGNEANTQQKIAVMEAMVNGVLVITGGPGTGKTTTINTIINMLRKDNKDVVLAAPTGRAAKRMTEATGVEAKTIHRLLGGASAGYEGSNDQDEKNNDEDDMIEADVIIIDEASMIDIILMKSLLSSISVGTKIIFVGDVDQLPSVGAGNVLSDIISSDMIKVVRLEQVFRQMEKSAIIRNAHYINGGRYPICNEEKTDFYFVHRQGNDKIVDTIEDLIRNRLPKFAELEGITDYQVLSPARKGELGVNNLNAVLQGALNPPKKIGDTNEVQYYDTIFREGDKVMQTKNNYETTWKIPLEMEVYLKNTETYTGEYKEGTGVYNGDTGRITHINSKDEIVKVTFDDNKIVMYDFLKLEELNLAYAITIHKSQGSEYPVVIIPMYQAPRMLMNRNLLYTGVTRAKKMVVLVGVESCMSMMVDNDNELKRYTGLSKRIVGLSSTKYFTRDSE